MHANAALLTRLFTALGERDHAAMASCYQPRSTFRDIAFHQRGIEEIDAMWRMICGGDIKVVKFEVIDANDRTGRARVVERYTVQRSEGPPEVRRPVLNRIESRFEFENGRIKRQDDYCDEKEWARQAVGGFLGFLAGRVRLMRSLKARRKLRKFRDRPA